MVLLDAKYHENIILCWFYCNQHLQVEFGLAASSTSYFIKDMLLFEGLFAGFYSRSALILS